MQFGTIFPDGISLLSSFDRFDAAFAAVGKTSMIMRGVYLIDAGIIPVVLSSLLLSSWTLTFMAS